MLEEADFVNSRIEFLSQDIIRHEGLLNAQGGAFAQSKAQEKQKVETLLKEKERLEKALRQECDGSLPYALAPNTLSRLLEKIANEAQIKQAKNFETELNQFLTQLKNDIAFRSSSESSTRAIATEAITNNLEAYMAAKPKGDLLFDISEREAGMLQQSIEQDSKKAWQRFDMYRQQLADIEQQLEQAAANIARAPEESPTERYAIGDRIKVFVKRVKNSGKNTAHCWKRLNGRNSSNWTVFVRYRKHMTSPVANMV